MSEYTPTTDDVRDAYTEGYGYHEEQFDRWLDEERRAAAEKALEPVRALHSSASIYPLDKDGQADMGAAPIAEFCRACTPESTIRAIEDAEWNEDCETAYWPCPTIRAIETKETKA